MLAPKITRIEAEKPYTLLITFETGERRLFDVSPYLNRGIFRELRDAERFAEARAERWGVSWPGGQDFSRDTLYLEGEPLGVIEEGTGTSART